MSTLDGRVRFPPVDLFLFVDGNKCHAKCECGKGSPQAIVAPCTEHFEGVGLGISHSTPRPISQAQVAARAPATVYPASGAPTQHESTTGSSTYGIAVVLHVLSDNTLLSVGHSAVELAFDEFERSGESSSRPLW